MHLSGTHIARVIQSICFAVFVFLIFAVPFDARALVVDNLQFKAPPIVTGTCQYPDTFLWLYNTTTGGNLQDYNCWDGVSNMIFDYHIGDGFTLIEMTLDGDCSIWDIANCRSQPAYRGEASFTVGTTDIPGPSGSNGSVDDPANAPPDAGPLWINHASYRPNQNIGAVCAAGGNYLVLYDTTTGTSIVTVPCGSVPLRVKGGDIAVLLLGHKRSGEPFAEEDIRFFEVFSAELAIGIQNSKSFDDLKQLSRELELRVTDRTKELEESKKMEVTKAQEVARLKDEFVFLAVHVLRTPVVAIKSFLEMTEGSDNAFPPEIRKNLSAIATASNHMSNLINDLLEISRSDSGSLKIEVAPQKFRPILDEVLSELMPLIHQKNLLLEVSVKEMPDVMCDRQRLKEVIENLVTNAVKYNKAGGSIFINAFRHAGEPSMLFEIRDTGYGIPKDLQSKIFQKFFRAVTPDTQEVLGSGLGLFITKLLVEKMGGSLMFSSVEHEGSTFAFTLPLAEPS